MKQCNRCGNSQCSLVKSEYPAVEVNGKWKGGMRTNHKVPRWAMCQECKKYAPMSAWKTTIFERMMASDPDKLSALLEKCGLQIREKKRYPYFYLVSIG